VDVARSNRRLVAWLGFVAFFASLAYAGNLANEEEDLGEPLYEPEFFIASIVGFAILAGAAVLIAIGTDMRSMFALRRPRSWPKALGISLLVFVGVLLVGAGLDEFVDPAKEQGLLPESWPPPDSIVFGLNAASVVIGAALAEEVLFRGIGYTLLERFGTPFAVVGSAAAWAAAHGLVDGFPLIFAFGLGLGLLRRASTSIFPGIVLHGVFNAFALAAAAISSAN
jgi:membrane protease YdiL (CAAX protease family)